MCVDTNRHVFETNSLSLESASKKMCNPGKTFHPKHYLPLVQHKGKNGASKGFRNHG